MENWLPLNELRRVKHFQLELMSTKSIITCLGTFLQDMFAFFLPKKSPFSYRTFVFSCLGVNFAFHDCGQSRWKSVSLGKDGKVYYYVATHGDAVIVIAKQLDRVQVIKRRTTNMSRKFACNLDFWVKKLEFFEVLRRKSLSWQNFI